MPFSAPSSPPETSVRNRLRPKYCNPAQLRGSAVKLFEAGYGYVRAARMLNIPANTVKDWSNPKLPGMHLVPEHSRWQGQT